MNGSRKNERIRKPARRRHPVTNRLHFFLSIMMTVRRSTFFCFFFLNFFYFPEDGETFQVKKSSHSKKVMKMLDKERKKKKYRTEGFSEEEKQITESINIDSNNKINKKGKNDNSNSIQTEIRTDDFVVRLLLTIFATS